MTNIIRSINNNKIIRWILIILSFTLSYYILHIVKKVLTPVSLSNVIELMIFNSNLYVKILLIALLVAILKILNFAVSIFRIIKNEDDIKRKTLFGIGTLASIGYFLYSFQFLLTMLVPALIVYYFLSSFEDEKTEKRANKSIHIYYN